MTKPNVDVIIIGAGIAGLKAASHLHNKGISTLILEARSRIGGRIYTERSTKTGNHYDLGASWFHSTMENPVFDKFVKDWYKPSDAKYDDHSVGIILDTESGSFPEGCNVGPIVDEMKYFASKLSNDESLQNSYIQYVNSKKGLLTKDEIKYSASLYKLAELMNGNDWSRISSKFAYGPFTGRDAFNTLGYDSVLSKIIENYPKENIKLDSVVRKVEKIPNGEGKADDTIIKVTTKDGKEFTSKYLIITIPLGVLKLSVENPNAEGAITFEPTLPKIITDNFSKTHFTTLAKVIVEFEEAFWPGQDKFIVLPTVKEEEIDQTKTYPIVEIDDYSNCEAVKAFDFPCLISNFKNVRNIPALMFLVPSQAAKQIEASSNPEEYGYELVKPILSKMTGKKIDEIPSPKLVLTTKWGSDPYSRGAISTNAPGDMIVNNELIDGFGNIRFAGEAYVLQGHVCAHGAYISGEREANVIAEKMGK